jgi:hypothetical protein
MLIIKQNKRRKAMTKMHTTHLDLLLQLGNLSFHLPNHFDAGRCSLGLLLLRLGLASGSDVGDVGVGLVREDDD